MRYLLLLMLLTGCVAFETKVETTPTPTPECTTNEDCAIAGCSGELCLPKDAASGTASICVFKEEYECLKLTTCGCNAGKCGWDENEKYRECVVGKSST